MSKLSICIRRVLPNAVRVLACTVLLSAITAGCLYLHLTAFPFLRTHLSATGLSPVAWIVEQLSFSLSFILTCVFLAIAYKGTDRRDGVASREKQWIILLLALFTYAILLPYIKHLSGEMYAAALASGAEIPLTDAGKPWTLMLKSFEWFIRFAIPLMILVIFYGARASRERCCPDTVTTPADAPAAPEKETTYETQE